MPLHGAKSQSTHRVASDCAFRMSPLVPFWLRGTVPHTEMMWGWDHPCTSSSPPGRLDSFHRIEVEGLKAMSAFTIYSTCILKLDSRLGNSIHGVRSGQSPPQLKLHILFASLSDSACYTYTYMMPFYSNTMQMTCTHAALLSL